MQAPVAPVWTCTNPALISPPQPQHDQFTFRTFRNNKRPWSCTTSQQGDIKGRNSKTARTAQAAKTRKLGKLGQPRKHERRKKRKPWKPRKPRKPQKARKPWKREKRENHENRKTVKPRRLAHNCLLHLSSSFCFFLFLNVLVFSVFSFSWFSPVFSFLCISSFWPRRASFLPRLYEPALISPPQQWSVYRSGYFWSPTKRPWSCTTFQQGTGWEEWFDRLHIPNSVFPPCRHLHFFRGFKKCQISQAAFKFIWATWKHSCRSAVVSSRSLLISDVASRKFHRHCHFAKFGGRRITGVVWTVLQIVGASACKSTQLVAPMGHHVLSCCLPSFAGWCRAKKSGKKIPSTSQGWDGHDLFVRQVPAQDSEHMPWGSFAGLPQSIMFRHPRPKFGYLVCFSVFSHFRVSAR